ncbi:MAG: DUF4160 domain-containing protein [Panacagrimonas sp.]
MAFMRGMIIVGEVSRDRCSPERMDKMPTVLRIGPYRFHFYSDERGEPPHIHVACGDGECKFWLDPIGLARNQGLAPHVLREIEGLVYAHGPELRNSYEQFHGK